ncbi:MAG: pro-sigmaK processing inhibitor BofA family protein [Bacteroides sp.]|nr:pro-sigmaK processing inhibitor BofA family protein [Bacteroides sp.]
MDAVALILGIFAMLLFIRLCGKQRKPVKIMLLNSLSGIALLAAAAVISGSLGHAVAVNYATVWISVALGAPGVAGILAVMLWL